MKIPIPIQSGARLASVLACSFIAAGAMSAKADLTDGLVANFSFETVEDVSFPRDGGALEGKGIIGKSFVEGIQDIPMIGKAWAGGGKQDNPEGLDDHELWEPVLTEGLHGNAVHFGVDVSSYLETDWNNEEIVRLFNFGANDDEEPTGFTVSAWVQVDEFTKNWQCPVAKGEQNQWRLHRRGGGTTMTGNGGNGDTPDGQAQFEPGDGLWRHIVLVSDIPGDRHAFYVDGEEDATEEGINPEGNIMPMMIGQNPDTGDRTWQGLVDEVVMWNRALTPEEIADLYNDGQGITLDSDPEIFFDFNTDPEGSFQVVPGGGPESEWRDSGGVDDSGYFSITDNTNGTRNTLIFDDVTDGLALRGFDFTVDLRVGGGTDRPADGFSLNLVTPEDPLLQEPLGQGFAGTRDLGAGEDNLPEEGSQTGLGIGLDAWVSGGIDVVGISVRVEGVLIDQFEMPTLNGEADDATSLQTGPQNLDDPDEPTALLTWQTFRAKLEEGTNKLSVWWKDTLLMDGVEVPWTPTSVRPIFAARTGGANQNHHIDNLRLVMIPARLASMSARVKGGQQLIVTATNGPESQFDTESLEVTLDLDGDGTQETIDVGEGVLDGNRRVYTYDPPASFFEPETSHAYTATGSDSLGNEFKVEGVWDIAPTNIFSGGFFTTRHVWTSGDQIGDREVCQGALDGDFDLQGDITVRHPYAHFHDNAGAPISGDLSGPYPLWAEPDFIADENIIAGERLGGGLGDHNDFAIESKGEFFLRNGGNILFVVNSDDGFVLEINGQELGEAGNRGRGNTVMEVELEAGTHQMRVIHWERGGGAGFSLYIARAPGLSVDDPVNKDNYEVLSGFNIHDVVTEDTDGDGMDDFKETFFFGDLSKDGSGDEDSDGLNDGLELANRADPTVKDTDGDGLEDGPEINDHGTDPSKVDSDGDSLADGLEVNDLKTSPILTDTDEDTFDENIEIALGTDPLDAASRPSAIIAVAAGNWNDPATWSNGEAPSPGNTYVAVGTVTKKLLSAAGTFGGDSLTLIGPDLTLDLDHSGDAVVNLVLNNANVSVKGDAELNGGLDMRGTVHIGVGDNNLSIGSVLSGGAHLTIQGGSADDAVGTVELTGEGSTFGGPLDIIGTDVAGIAPGSLGIGSMLLAGGGVAYGYDYDSDISLVKIQGDNFRMVFGGTVKVADILGVDPDGGVLFSLNDLAGPGPYTADDLLAAFQLDEGITGEGTIELGGTDADTDGDGLRDEWETANLGDLTQDGDGDPDGDGLDNHHEQAGGTDPTVPDTVDVDEPTRLVVHYDFNDGAGTAINNSAPGGAAGELVNAHAGAWVAEGGVGNSGYLNFTQDGATSADSQHILTGIPALELPKEGSTDYTMMAWTRFENTAPGGDSEDNMIFGQLSNGNVLHNGARGAQYYMGHWGNDIGGGEVVVDEWHHVAWRYQEGVQAIFVDGAEVASEAKGNLAEAADIVIGATRGDQDRDFSGDLDDIRIYNGAVSVAKIAEIAASPRPPAEAGKLYAQDFEFPNDTTDLGDGSIITSNDGTNSVQDGALRMTQAETNGTAASFLLPPFDASKGWEATFDFSVEHTGGNTPADGFSINYGAIPGPDDFGAPAEEGYGDAVPHVSYQVDTWKWDDPAQDAGVGIEVTGAEIAYNEALNDNANFKPEEKVSATATLRWDPSNGATFTTTGLRVNADFVNVPTPGFEATADHGFSIIARTGGHNETVTIDNLVITSLDNPWKDGLVAYYPLNGNANDVAGGHDGVGKAWEGGGKQDQPELLADHPLAELTYGGGKFGQGVDLDGGAAQYIETPLESEDVFDFGAPDNPTGFTVSAWARVDSFGKGWQALIAKGEQNQWRIHRQGGDTNRVVGNGGAGDIAREGPDISDGAIHHIVLVSNPEAGHVRLYVDGVLAEEGGAPSLEDNPMPMMIGQNPDTDDRTWDGLIDDVALWARPLSEEEVTELSTSGLSLGALAGIDTGGGGVTPPEPGLSLGDVVKAGDGPISFSFPEGTYDVEYSTDLETWEVIASDVTGTYEDNDAGRNGAAGGYYRAVQK